MVLWPGDTNFDGTLKYTGSDNDRDGILMTLNSIDPTTVVAGYHNEDVNMDGVVKYTGADNDRELVLLSIGGEVTTTIRLEQMP